MPFRENRGSHKLMKEINTRLVFSLIKQYSPISRITISKETGLSKSSVSEIVDSLIAKDIIREGGSGDSLGGRRPILLYLNSKGRYSVGIQVGDYGEIRGVLCDLESNIMKEKRSFYLDQDELIPRICEIIDHLVDGMGSSVLGVGLAVPGIVDYQKGCIVSAVNPGWTNVPLVHELKNKYNFPIYIENLTSAAALGENWVGAGVDFDTMIYIGLGSVVGAAIIINGTLHCSQNRSAGELGHMVITNEKIKCHCGRYGCIESLISKPAIYHKLFLEEYTMRTKPQINPDNIFNWLLNLEKEADPEGREFGKNQLDAIATTLGTAITNLVNLLGTDAVIIGSELTESAHFMAVLQEKVIQEIIPRSDENLVIRKSSLGENNVVLGAATLVLQSAFNVAAANNGELSVRYI